MMQKDSFMQAKFQIAAPFCFLNLVTLRRIGLQSFILLLIYHMRHCHTIICLALLLFPSDGSIGQSFNRERVLWQDGQLTDRLDSLSLLLQASSTRPSKRVDALNHLASIYLAQQPDTALQYTRLALEEAEAISYHQGLAAAHQALGRIFTNSGAFSQAVGNFSSAISFYQKIGDWEGEAATYNHLGELYYYTHQLEETLIQHQRALTLYQTHKRKKGEALTLGYLGHFYEKQGDYEEALNYQQHALSIYDELQDFSGLSTINGNLGSIYEDLEQYDKAYQYFSLALQYNLETNDELERVIHLNNIADTYRKRGMYEEAIDYTRRSYALAQRLGQTYQLESALRDLSKTYALQGDFEKAHENLESAHDLYVELYNRESAQQLSQMQSLLEISEQQKEIAILERENHIDRLVRNVVIGGMLMFVLLAGIALSRQRLKSRKDRALHEAQQEIIQKELENAQLSEQRLQTELSAKSQQLTAHALHLIQKNSMLKDLKLKLQNIRQQHKDLDRPLTQLIKIVDNGFSFDQDWEDFRQIFEQVHQEFYHQLNRRFPDLTAAEIRLCALLRLNLGSKDISTILGISSDSLRVTRYRLRKKMGLEKGVNLVAFIMNI